MRSSRHLRNLFEQLDVFRMLTEFVVADERGKRLAAENAELIFVDLLEHHALVEFRSALKVTQQLFLADIQDAELEHRAGFALVHEVLDPTPAGFQLLKSRMMKDFVQLEGDKVINLGHTSIDRGVRVAREFHLAFENLRHKLLDHIPAAIARDLFASKPPLFDDLIQQARFSRFSFRRLSGCLLRLTHLSLPRACPSLILFSTGRLFAYCRL